MLNGKEKTTPAEVGATETGVTRREFIGKTLAAGAGVALGALLPHTVDRVDAQAPPCTAPAVNQTLVTIGEIKKTTPGGPVQGVIKILNENKMYLGGSTTGSPVCQSGQMRYFTGSLPGSTTDLWPPKNGNPAPGPTIRARVGDTVEITLLNQVNVEDFGNSLDTGEKGEGCDVSTQAGPGGTVNIYPGNPPFDTMPNCYHGSSTANLHYHGTHVTPNIIGDNVFVQLRPSPRAGGKPVVNEAYLAAHHFGEIFTQCREGHSPQKWSDLPPLWQQAQKELLEDYDKTAVWQGKRGLPASEQLWPKDERDINAKPERWPQYYRGAYPSCFQLPVWNGEPDSMGQAPGTHWYHAHKHGSTSLNLANGMAGAFIIEGDYDDKLKPLYNKQHVLVLQTYAAQIGTLRAPGTSLGDLVYVNGQYTPVIEMQPNEVQFWRIVNACSGKSIPINGPSGVKWIQTAQDGVQLSQDNYELGVQIAQQGGTWTNATLTTPMIAPPWFGNLAPGNRVDMLVQAPSSTGTFPVTFGTTLLFTIKVTGDPVSSPIPFPPDKSALAPLPGFLTDLDPAKAYVHRDLRFKSAAREGQLNIQDLQTINNKMFEDHVFDQTMELGATEEWTLYNEPYNEEGVTASAHPFHIHVNPFQVIEILNPKVSKNPFKLPKPWIWWDDIAIPPAATPPDGDGTLVTGYIKILSRFADFTGAYVLHCHILDHEDRGMMQMVQVVSNKTAIGHH
jgi:FtsP/CotA-like multicopper oxidase with cupredoxin domain